MARGRLIFPFTAVIAQLDTTAMAGDPDDAGPLTTGYDLDFREPIAIAADSGDRIGDPLRIENLIEIPCQVETGTFEQQTQVLSGTSPDSRIVLVFHFKELEQLDLVDPDGVAKIRLNDRLDKIVDKCDNDVQVFRNPPGVFATQVMPAGYGLGPRRNLLLVTFNERELGIQSPAR